MRWRKGRHILKIYVDTTLQLGEGDEWGKRRECGYPSRTPPPRTPPPQEPRNETLFSSSSSSSLFVHLKSKQNEKKRGKTKQEKRRADEKGETKGKAMFGGKVSRVVEEEEEIIG